MKYIKLALLMALILTLAGCDDDFFDGGGASSGGGSSGDYETYHGVQEVLSRRGYVGFISMTQKPESPAPQSDQEDCPTVMVVLMLLGSLCVWQMRSGRFTLRPQW